MTDAGKHARWDVAPYEVHILRRITLARRSKGIQPTSFFPFPGVFSLSPVTHSLVRTDERVAG